MSLTFVKSQSGGSVHGGHVYDFPALEAFDKSGRLVYRSHDGNRNAAVLRSLPLSLSKVAEIPDQPDLTASLRMLARISEHDRQILVENRLPTVIAFMLDECNACTVQESALAPEKAKDIAARGINIVVVRVIP